MRRMTPLGIKTSFLISIMRSKGNMYQNDKAIKNHYRVNTSSASYDLVVVLPLQWRQSVVP